MEKPTQKWGIIALLEDIQDGAEFHYTEFPLHITLAGVFSIGLNGETLTNELADLLVDQKIIEVKSDKKDMFGPNRDVEVMKMERSPELLNLYNKIHSWLLVSGAVYNDPQYQGDGYLPHSAFQKNGFLNENEIREIRSVSIIDLFPNSDGYKRKVFRTIKFM